MNRHKHNRLRAGFTLVELLVVITIIGILAGLLLPAVFGSIKTARRTSIAEELSQLAKAIESYKSKHIEYPPDFSNEAAVTSHLAAAYPRSVFQGGAVVTWLRGPAVTLDPAEALVFWLSKMKKDPRNPITGSGDFDVLFDFDATRLVDLDGDGWQEYLPRYVRDAPFVYFDGRVQQTPQGVSTSAYFYGVYPPEWSPQPPASPSGARPPSLLRSGNPPAGAAATFGIVRPYRSNTAVSPTQLNTDPTFPNTQASGSSPGNPTTWINVGKFQIITAGLDALYGRDNFDGSGTVIFKQYPAQNYYVTPPTPATDANTDDDNMMNFSDGKTVADSRP